MRIMRWNRYARPSPRDAARRLLILARIVDRAYSEPARSELEQMLSAMSDDDRARFETEAESRRDDFCRELRDAKLWKHLSPLERSFATATTVTMTEQQQIDASWRLEAVQVLVWALDLLPELPPFDRMASVDLLAELLAESPRMLTALARLRDRAEIDRACDVAALWHWRSAHRAFFERGGLKITGTGVERVRPSDVEYRNSVRDVSFRARENGVISDVLDDDFPALGKPYRDLTNDEWSEVGSITRERYFTLNWLCGSAPYKQWDETPTDT